MKKFMFQNISSSNNPVQELIISEVIYIQYKNPLNLEDVKQFRCNYYLSDMISILITVPFLDVTVAKNRTGNTNELLQLLFVGHAFHSNYCTIPIAKNRTGKTN